MLNGNFGPEIALVLEAAARKRRSSIAGSVDLDEQAVAYAIADRALIGEELFVAVYNHTAEGDHLGPTLSFRGIDNAAYYRLSDSDRRYNLDYTGCGNSLNVRHPHALQLIMDSLRYWVTEMHVDGFRFDLAAALAREFHDVDRLSAFFDLVQQDPIVSQVKLIAEPWDVGEGGYQVGNFPPLWTEWNGKYRDSVRDFWRGESVLQEFASRLTGSSDLYADDGRRPLASINFVTCHDGFSLHDLVAYDHKHNDANGENSRDGTDDNRSWNHGTEGETSDPHILALRRRQKRNFIATLFLSQGVPMLSHGDELGRTQAGNNNVYCQDNELAWMPWQDDDGLIRFVSRVSELRGAHPVFRRRRFFEGRTHGGALDGERDIVWLTPSGQEMAESDWHTGYARAVAVYLNGDAITEPDTRGQRVRDDSFLLLFNAHSETITFRLPDEGFGVHWEVALDTATDLEAAREPLKALEEVEVVDRGLLLLRRLSGGSP